MKQPFMSVDIGFLARLLRWILARNDNVSEEKKRDPQTEPRCRPGYRPKTLAIRIQNEPNIDDDGYRRNHIPAARLTTTSTAHASTAQETTYIAIERDS